MENKCCCCCRENVCLYSGKYKQEFIKVNCCHLNKMVISNSVQDSIDQNLYHTLNELHLYKLPFKSFKLDNNLVAKEISNRLTEIRTSWLSLKMKQSQLTRMVELLAKIRSYCLEYEHFIVPPFFTPNDEDLYPIMDNLKYFGFMWGTGKEVAKLFLYDICLFLYKDYSCDANFAKAHDEWNEGDDSSIYEKLIDKDIMDNLMFEVVYYFKMNSN